MSEVRTCANCHNTDFECLQTEVRFSRQADVLRCKRCDLIFLDQDSFDLPQDFYNKEYHQTYLAHVEPSVLDPQKYYEKMLKVTAPWAEKLKASFGKDDCILDLGCSTGHLMSHLKEHVDEIYGHDINEKETTFAREELGLKVESTPLGERFKPGTFDAITMIFVFEHIAAPYEFLTYIKPFLKEGGKIHMLVPNIEDALVSLYDLPDFRNFYYCVEHLFYYSPKTLAEICSKAGYEVKTESLQEYPITNHLNWVYKNQPMDVIASRSPFPYVRFRPDKEILVKDFWISVNAGYKEFLKEQGHGDRIWAELSRS